MVLGHSVGGSMAVHCAARYPEACQAMITMSAVTFVEQRTLSGICQARAWFAARAANVCAAITASAVTGS